MLGEVLRNRLRLFVRQADHRRDELTPSILRVAGGAGDHVQVVTAGAAGADRVLAGPVWQLNLASATGLASLPLNCNRQSEREQQRGDEWKGPGSEHF